MDMDLVFIEETVVELWKQEISSIGVTDVHGFFEDISQTTCKHDSSLYLFFAGKRFLEWLDVGQSAAVVATSQADGEADTDWVMIFGIAVGIAKIVS
jgi:hypothetical protein